MTDIDEAVDYIIGDTPAATARVCARCGVPITGGNRRIYCPDCLKVVKAERKKEPKLQKETVRQQVKPAPPTPVIDLESKYAQTIFAAYDQCRIAAKEVGESTKVFVRNLNLLAGLFSGKEDV